MREKLFMNLRNNMDRFGVNKQELADVAGCTLQSIYNKLAGKQEFQCDEMFAIRDKLFEGMSIDRLFIK